MDFSTFARSRKSVRGYKKDAVPREVIDEIINTAKFAPSSYNTQTWKIHVLAGEVLNKIREGNTRNTMGGVPFQRGLSLQGGLPGRPQEAPGGSRHSAV